MFPIWCCPKQTNINIHCLLSPLHPFSRLRRLLSTFQWARRIRDLNLDCSWRVDTFLLSPHVNVTLKSCIPNPKTHWFWGTSSYPEEADIDSIVIGSIDHMHSYELVGCEMAAILVKVQVACRLQFVAFPTNNLIRFRNSLFQHVNHNLLTTTQLV